MSTLQRAIEVAFKAHVGQVDKAGVDYIEHPLAVMTRLSTESEKITAVLHDVIEDTFVTLDDIGREFSAEVVDALTHMTHAHGQDYKAYVRGIATNHVAIRVKMADLLENMRAERVPADKAEWYAKRVQLYQWAYQYLAAEIVTFGMAAPGEPIRENVEFAAAEIARLRASDQPSGSPQP